MINLNYKASSVILSFLILSFLILFCITEILYSQTTWERIYPGYPKEDHSLGSCQLSDGNFILVGYARTPYKKLKLLKIQPNGDTLWSRIYGNDDEDYEAYSVIAKNDGTFMITGSSDSGGFLMKYDLNGNRLWSKNYPGVGGKEIIEAPNGGFLVGASFLTDSAGNLVWVNTPSNGEFFESTCKVENNYFAVVSIILTGSIYKSYISKYDFNGNIIWRKNIDALNGFPYKVKYYKKNYHIWGSGGFATQDSTKFYIARLDSAGNILLNKHLFYPRREHNGDSFFDVLDNGNYIFSTFQTDMQIVDTTMCVLRVFNPAGDLIKINEIKNFFGGFNLLSNFLKLSNGDFLFTGYYQRTYPGHNAEFYAIRSDSNLFFHSTGIISQNIVVKYFSLSQNYPNPFNPLTRINYELQIANYVFLNVYDINGKLVKELINEKQSAGNYSIDFDGSGLPSGTYIYRLQAGEFSETKKMVLLK